MSTLNLLRSLFVVAKPLQCDPNLVTSLICLTSAKSAFLPSTPNSFLLRLRLLSRLCRPSELILSPSLEPRPGTEVIPHSGESKHSPLWAFKLCLFSELHERCSGDPPPLPSNTTTNDIPLLASVQYTAWENTTAPEKGGRTTNQEFWPAHPSVEATPSLRPPSKNICHSAYINPSYVPNSLAAENEMLAKWVFQGTVVFF